MPIRPSQRALYPADWPAIRARILARDYNKCMCTGQCGDKHTSYQGSYTVRNGLVACNARNGEYIARFRAHRADYRTEEQYTSGEYDLDPLLCPVRVVLTIAHLDHDPRNNADANLLACCQRCHLRIDRHEHAKNARAMRRARKAVGELFEP